MLKINRLVALLGAFVMAAGVLTGCTSQDKSKVEETASTFLAIVADESEEDINNYASSEVASGDFVQLFDADALVAAFVQGFNTSELTDDTKAEVDTFCAMFDRLIRDYEVSGVEVGKDNTATAVATIKTKFPVELMQSESVATKIGEATEAYYTNNEEEIAALYEQGEEVAEEKTYNDMIRIIMQIYEDEILSSSETTYAINLSLEKNPETDSWIVTSVEDYKSAHAE